MFSRDFVTASTEGELFSQALFRFIQERAARTSDDEAFAIVHSEPHGDCQRRRAQFASAEALAEFERYWRDTVRGRPAPRPAVA